MATTTTDRLQDHSGGIATAGHHITLAIKRHRAADPAGPATAADRHRDRGAHPDRPLHRAAATAAATTDRLGENADAPITGRGNQRCLRLPALGGVTAERHGRLPTLAAHTATAAKHEPGEQSTRVGIAAIAAATTDGLRENPRRINTAREDAPALGHIHRAGIAAGPAGPAGPADCDDAARRTAIATTTADALRENPRRIHTARLDAAGVGDVDRPGPAGAAARAADAHQPARAASRTAATADALRENPARQIARGAQQPGIAHRHPATNTAGRSRSANGHHTTR